MNENQKPNETEETKKTEEEKRQVKLSWEDEMLAPLYSEKVWAR